MDVFLQALVCGHPEGWAHVGLGMTHHGCGHHQPAHGQLMMLAMYITFVLFQYGHRSVHTLIKARSCVWIWSFPLMKLHHFCLMTGGHRTVITKMRFIFTSQYLFVTLPTHMAIFIGGISFYYASPSFSLVCSPWRFWFPIKTDLGRSILSCCARW